MIRVGVDSPRVVELDGNGYISAKKLGILRAMRLAVAQAEIGELIVQADMTAANEGEPGHQPGAITILDAPTSWPAHVCPRAFILGDEEIREELLRLWSDETRNACRGWWPIRKIQGPILFSHP